MHLLKPCKGIMVSPVCRLVCWFVSRIKQNYRTEFHETSMEVESRLRIYPLTFQKGKIQEMFLTFCFESYIFVNFSGDNAWIWMKK